MNFATGLFGTDPSLVPIIARKAEEVGFDSLWTPDHLVPPLNIPSTYPYSDSNNPPFAPESPWLDVFVSLAVAAANTRPPLFGNFSYYGIRTVNSVEIFRFMDSRTMQNNQVECLAFSRRDGRPMGGVASNICEAYATMVTA